MPGLTSRPKAALDACVLYPPVLRAILLGVAARGLYAPVWSPRILEEWARAAARGGASDEAAARAEIARMRARWPRAERVPDAGTMARLWLPDPNDVHVLAAASDAGADDLVTLNLRDFPKGEVMAEDLRAVAPDAFLMDLWLREPQPIEAAVADTVAQAAAMSGAPVAPRALLKRARLPRLGKAVERADGA